MNKHKNLTKRIAALAAATLLSTASYANSEAKIAPGLSFGAGGFGLDARMLVMDDFYARAGIVYFGYSYRPTSSKINYKADLTMLRVPVMVDYHPMSSGFKVSAGLAYNGTKIETKASSAGAKTFNGRTYTAAEIGSVKGEIKYKNVVAPILSLGYDSSFVDPDPLSFTFEAGVMYAGPLKAKVTTTGTLKNDAQFNKDIQNDFDKVASDGAEYLKWTPVISIGLRYSF